MSARPTEQSDTTTDLMEHMEESLAENLAWLAAVEKNLESAQVPEDSPGQRLRAACTDRSRDVRGLVERAVEAVAQTDALLADEEAELRRHLEVASTLRHRLAEWANSAIG